jgi:hypothetical protein
LPYSNSIKNVCISRPNFTEFSATKPDGGRIKIRTPIEKANIIANVCLAKELCYILSSKTALHCMTVNGKFSKFLCKVSLLSLNDFVHFLNWMYVFSLLLQLYGFTFYSSSFFCHSCAETSTQAGYAKTPKNIAIP